MKVYGLWYGGASYSVSSIPEHVEEFDSMNAAKNAFADRENVGYYFKQHFQYVNRDPEDAFTPAVEGSEMQIYFYDPSEENDPYPDRIMDFGPRGGIRVVPC